MAAYCRVYDSRHLQADCQEPGSALEPYARQSSTSWNYVFYACDYGGVVVKKFRWREMDRVSSG